MNKKQKLEKYLQKFNQEIQWRKMQRFIASLIEDICENLDDLLS